MGDQYVTQLALHGCPDISCSAYRVLMRMAAVVYDRESEPGADDEGLFWGGWRALTAVLGYGVTLEWDEISPAAKRTIARAIRDLRRRGYISVADKKWQHKKQGRVYRLSLTGYALEWDIRGQSV